MKNDIWIPSSKIEFFKKSFAAVVKKAEKFKMPLPSLVVTDMKKTFKIPCEHRIYDSNLLRFSHIQIEKVKCVIEGELPVFSGWTPLAKLDHEFDPTKNKYSNIISQMGYSQAFDNRQMTRDKMKDLMECKPNCEHCKQQRVRKETYLLLDEESKKVIQVGSTCVDDFLGDKSLLMMSRLFDINSLLISDHDSDIVERYAGTSSACFQIPLPLFVAIANDFTVKQGFTSLSNGSALTPSTSTLVKSALINPTTELAKIINDFMNNVESPEIKRATEICELMGNKKPINGFLVTSVSIANRGFVDLSDRLQVGVVSSWPSSIMKDEEKAKKLESSLNEHYGEEKQRGDLKLHVIRLYSDHDAMYPYVRVTMRDDAGRTFQWKASMGGCPEIVAGKTYTLTGTIKGHEEYKDTKITQLTRCASFEECASDTQAPVFIKEKVSAAKKKAALASEGLDR